MMTLLAFLAPWWNICRSMHTASRAKFELTDLFTVLKSVVSSDIISTLKDTFNGIVGQTVTLLKDESSLAYVNGILTKRVLS